MFKNNKESNGKMNKSIKNGQLTSNSVNIIGAGTVIEGEIESKGDIRVDGKIKGTVTSESKIVIGNTGQVEGNIHCANADVSGKVSGTISVKELLFLKGTAFIEGDISTSKIVVESGAQFNGNCDMGANTRGKNEEKPSKELRKEAV